MDDKYNQWIIDNVQGDGYGQCAEITDAMQKEFPELIRVRGHYLCYAWGERSHWWLRDNKGEVIDPTKMQFPSIGIGLYKEWIDGSPEPTGKCPNCEGYCYNHDFCCSDECSKYYACYCQSGAIRL